MKKIREKNLLYFIRVSSYVPFSIAEGTQSTFCFFCHSNCDDMLLVTKVSSAKSWHQWVSPCCSSQQR